MKWPWERDEGPLFERPQINTTDAIYLGELAERLKTDPIFVHSVERAEARLRVEWQYEPDPVKRDELWRRSSAFRAVSEELDAIIAEGVAAKAEQDADEKRLKAVNQ